MEIKIEKIRSFSDLIAWQEGHKLVLLLLRSTSSFPKEETRGLISHITRAALSITSNLVEGFSRGPFKEKVQFYSYAIKGVREIQNYIIVAHDLGYLDSDSFDKIASQTAVVNKLCNELVKSGKK